MKILMISKAFVTGVYQKKLEELAAIEGIQLRLVVPPYWRTGRHSERLVCKHCRGYEMSVQAPMFNGHFHYHFYPSLAREISDFGPDIVHVDEEPYNFASAHAIWLAQKHSARALFFSWQNLNRRYPPPFSWIEKYCYRQAAAIAGTDGAKDVLREKGFDGQLAVIPQFGVDPELFHPKSEEFPSSQFTIGYVGRLVEEKGLKYLLAAMTGLPSVRLRIAGRGPLCKWIVAFAAAKNISGRVSGPTPIAAENVPDFLHSLDLLVLPSVPTPNWTEQFGRVLVEAMACQVPVVASNSGEIASVLGNAGKVIPPGNERALIEAVEDIRSNADLAREMGYRGRERVLQNFTHQHIARATSAFYSNLLSSQTQARP